MVQLTACSRVRPAAAGLLNGTLPGSAAAAAAVNLYTGAAGARADLQMSLLSCGAGCVSGMTRRVGVCEWPAKSGGGKAALVVLMLKECARSGGL